MDNEDCETVILDAARKYFNGHSPDFKLFRGGKSYTSDQIIVALEKDPRFKQWFVENVLRLSTELFVRGKT